MLVNHWVSMIVYLHHSDPATPHYREGAWTYSRGALATIDRDFLGWQGRFFLHDVGGQILCHTVFANSSSDRSFSCRTSYIPSNSVLYVSDAADAVYDADRVSQIMGKLRRSI
jgi:hypothetical protein